MRDTDVAALVTYAAGLDPTVEDDAVTVDCWTDQLRGIAADLDTARAAVRKTVDRLGRAHVPAVRIELLPIGPKAHRRWGTALVAPNPYETPYQREARRRRGLAKTRSALAREPLPIEPAAAGLTDREQRILQAAAARRDDQAETACDRCDGTGTVYVRTYGGHTVPCGMCIITGRIDPTERNTDPS